MAVVLFCLSFRFACEQYFVRRRDLLRSAARSLHYYLVEASKVTLVVHLFFLLTLVSTATEMNAMDEYGMPNIERSIWMANTGC